MKWLDKWFDKQIERIRSKEYGRASQVALDSPRVVPSSQLNGNGFTFTIYPATGGHVIEFRSHEQHTGYNQKHVDPVFKLHVIPTSENLGEELTKIITYECLRN